MEFDKEFYKKEFERLLNLNEERKFYIRKSSDAFKIDKFIRKSADSFELADYVRNSKQSAKDYWTITICYYSMLYLAKSAILTKGYETDDHYATQIALGHLLVPNEIEKEDLELLEQAHKIFENDYIEYFEDARKESSVSRYSATKVENARKFISKLRVILEK